MKVKLGDICKIYSGGDKPKVVSPKKTEECKIPIYGNSVDEEGLYGYTNFSVIDEKAVTISARGSNCGTAFFRNEPYVPIVRLLSLVPCDKLIVPEYLYYVIKNRPFKRTGSGQPQITIPQVSDCEVEIEENINIQKRIAKVLFDIDSKIKNNNVINAELEAMARTIYDYWFLQFDFPDENGKPYKSSGGKMVWNEELKRKIPEEWRVGNLSEIASITMGSSPKGESLNEDKEGIIFYQGKTDFGYRFPRVRMYTNSPIRYAEVNDILLSVRAPVGDMNITSERCCIGRGLAAINSRYQSFLFYLMLSNQYQFDKYNNKGTTFGAITKEELFGLRVVIPDGTIIEIFDKKISDIDKNIFSNEMQNQELTSLRDFLLPLLMNGQVGFKE